MKKTLTLLSLPGVLLSTAALAYGGTYTFVAPGVNVDNIASSTAFYDNGKGYYFWGEHWESNKDTVERLYLESGNNYDFLGQLAEKIDCSQAPMENTFAKLKDDRNGCWYNADSNVLQYWQNYYGFAQNKGTEAPNGYTYNPQYAEALGGTQSLQINMLFYRYADPQGGGSVYNTGYDWFLNGKCDTDAFTNEAIGKAGFYSSYFGYGSKTCLNRNFFVSGEYRRDMGTAADDFIRAFGLKADAQGALLQDTAGQIASVSLRHNNMGHEITCYGFTLNEQGELNSVYLADNQDSAYRLEQVFLKLDDNQVDIRMYTDRECTNEWVADGYTWKLQEITSVLTPNSLKEAYAAHRSSLEQDASEGFSGKESVVRLTGTAAVSGAVQADTLLAGTNNEAAALNAQGESAALELRTLDKQGAAALSVNGGIRLSAGDVKVQGGKLVLSDGAELAATGSLLLQGDAAITCSGTAKLNYGNIMELAAADGKEGRLELNEAAASCYTMGSGAFTATNATITVNSAADKSIGTLLVNTTLVNNGTGTLTEDNALNKGTAPNAALSAEARNGSIHFLNKGAEGMQLADLLIASGQTIGVYQNIAVQEAEETRLAITGSLTGFSHARLNADVTLMAGALLDVSAAEAGGITLGSSLTFERGITLSEADISALEQANGTPYRLFTGVDSLTLAGSDYIGTTTAITLADAVDAHDYFSNLETGRYSLIYSGGEGGGNAGCVSLVSIPEPTTATLSLLALAGLCTRRRRH